MFCRIGSQLLRNKGLASFTVSRNMSVTMALVKPMARCNLSTQLQIRGYKNVRPKNAKVPKTKSGIKKRFIATASGALKYAHAGKYHLNIGKSSKRLNRLGKNGLLKGTWLAKMNMLIR